MRSTLALFALACGPFAGCGGETTSSDDAARFAGVLLEVRRGQDVERLTLPSDLPPDFAEEDRRAWKLSTLFGSDYAGRTTLLEAHAREGRPMVLGDALALSPQGVWVLRTNQKGGAVLTQVDPADPFPDFHGRGGNRGRPGEAGDTRLREVVRLRVQLGPPKAERPAASAPTVHTLLTEVDGVERTLDETALARIGTLEVKGDGGQDSRPATSLRALALDLAGASARVTAVVGASGERLALDPASWANPQHVPVLRRNRRGDLKFHWVDAQGTPIDALPSLRAVQRVVVQSR